MSELTKVLFLAANADVPRISFDRETRRIHEAFKLGSQGARFELHYRSDVRWRDLAQAIVEIRPDIIHFSGHGLPGGRLVLTDDRGDGQHEVPLDALRALLEALPKPRLLVLNACYTAEQAEHLVHVAHRIIAMQGEISDDGASIFSQGFYSALACGHDELTCYRVALAELTARSIEPRDARVPRHRGNDGASAAAPGKPSDEDPFIEILLQVSTRINVYPLLPRMLARRLAELFPTASAILNVVSQADVLIQAAGRRIPEPFTGKRLRIGGVPLEAGADHAWACAIRDAPAISPYALLAILLVAREEKGVAPEIDRALDVVLRAS
jgi:hypothetical protein